MSKWYVKRWDVKSVFFKSGRVHRDVCAIPPRYHIPVKDLYSTLAAESRLVFGMYNMQKV